MFEKRNQSLPEIWALSMYEKMTKDTLPLAKNDICYMLCDMVVAEWSSSDKNGDPLKSHVPTLQSA